MTSGEKLENNDMWNQVKELLEKFDSNKKYLSDFENIGTWREGEVKLYNKKQLYHTCCQLLLKNISPSYFLNTMQEYTPIIRDGKIHNPLCEYATEHACNCPCASRYHGLRGKELEQ